MKTKQLFASLLLIAAFLLLTPRAASANSAPKFWLGADAYGSVTMDADCPLTVEHELLTFDIPDFPSSGKNDHYRASVTAQYTFFNPTDQTITARLEFPFGEAPNYGVEGDLTKYDITVNGTAIEKTVRHTIMGTGENDFKLDRDIAKITDGFKEDDFFTPDLPVTKYVFEILDYEKNVHAGAAFDFPKNRNSRVYLDGMNDRVEMSDSYRLGRIAGYSNNTLTVYVFGEQLDTPPEWTFYSDDQLSVRVDGTTALASTDRMTFKELVTSIYPENSAPLETDWYNAVVDELTIFSKGSVISGARVFETKRRTLMRWYEYEITIPAGERIVNTVTAPIYPTINEGVNPSLYEYTYLLSPAQSWADFGSLEVVINTPYYLRETGKSQNSDGFEKTEAGYKASFDGLPEGELGFSLRAKEHTIGDITGNVAPWFAFFIIVGYVGAIVGVCLVFTAIVRKLKKKRSK